jgi:uncharacterized membrane protein
MLYISNMKDKKNIIIMIIAEVCLIVGAYVTIIQRSLLGIILLGLFVLFIPYYIINRKNLMKDEMLRVISDKASGFSSIIIFAVIIILSLIVIKYPFISNKIILFVMLTTMIASKILYQLYWFFSTMKSLK